MREKDRENEKKERGRDRGLCIEIYMIFKGKIYKRSLKGEGVNKR